MTRELASGAKQVNLYVPADMADDMEWLQLYARRVGVPFQRLLRLPMAKLIAQLRDLDARGIRFGRLTISVVVRPRFSGDWETDDD